jgi:hypothetical protein
VPDKRRTPARQKNALSAAAAALSFALAAGLGGPLSGSALAQGNYQSSPLGGRSALLGGTGVVLGVDGAAPYLNPATMTRIEDTSLAFSSKFYQFSRRSIDRWEQPGLVDAERFGGLNLGDTSTSDDELGTLPDSTCFFIEGGPRGVKKRAGAALAAVRGSHKFSFCIGKIEEGQLSINAEPFAWSSDSVRVNRSRSLNYDWSRWSVGPSWSYNINDKLAIGLSLHGTLARYEQSMSVVTSIEDVASGKAMLSSLQSAVNGSAWGLIGYAGATYQATDIFSVGLSVRSPSLHFFNGFSGTFSGQDTFGGASSGTYLWAGEGSFVTTSPLRIALGGAAEWTRIRLELNGFWYPALFEFAGADVLRDEVNVALDGTLARGKSRLPISEDAKTVVNVGLGSEIFVRESLSLLLGVLTDFSALPPMKGTIPGGSRLFYDRKSAVHASLGMVSYTDYGDLVLGARMSFASGQMASVNAFVSPARLEPVYYSEIGGMLVFAGRMSLRTLVKTARSIEEAWDKGGDPDMKKPTEPMRRPTKKD